MKPNFPGPTYFGRQRHWPLSALLKYEAEVSGAPAPEPLPPTDEVYLSAAQVRARYGGVSDMCGFGGA